jgi:capsular polysaccharide transport system permease protein
MTNGLTATETQLTGLTRQMRVIGALIMREIHTRYGRENIGFLWVFVEPILFVGGIVGIRGLFETGIVSGGVSFQEVMFTGYPPLVMWRSAVLRNSKSLRINAALLFHRQVQPLDIVMSRILLESASTIFAYSACYLIMDVLGFVHLPYDWPWFILGWGFHFWYAVASGILIAGISEMTEVVDRIIHVFTYLMLPMSGMFYLVSWLPPTWRELALYLPSVNAYEILRYGYFGPRIHFYWDMQYLVLFLLVETAVGLSLLKLGQKYMVQE